MQEEKKCCYNFN